MSLTKKEINNSSKAPALNPNAAEFVPLSLRSPVSSSTSGSEASVKFPTSSLIGKSSLDRSESSASRKSDEDAQKYWQCQLPDDITPDFKGMSEDDSQGYGGLSLAGLSLYDTAEASRLPASTDAGYIFADQQEISQHHVDGNNFSDKIRFSASSYGGNPALSKFLHFANKPWDKQIITGDQNLGSGREGYAYGGSTGHGVMNEMIGETGHTGDVDTNLEFLVAQFPGFASDSLTEVYFANGCDLHLTIEMLTQLELQVDGGLNQSLNSKPLSTPNLNAMDFPALTLAESRNIPVKYSGDDFSQSRIPYSSLEKENLLMFKTSPSAPSRGSIDFASAVRKLASQDSGIWKFERNGSVDSAVGSSRNSHVIPNAYNSPHGRSIYADRIQSRGSARPAPVWLETGDAVANMYSCLREEARDHARIRNAYFEQARQAYLIGNKGLAKELSVKGQLHNMQMKAAHEKAQEAIYRQRNPVGPENMRGNERMIDLHGLHVTEAIHVLKQELSMLRSAARAADQRFQVYICVGTGHHTKGSRTPSRLPIAVQHFLVEEGLGYTEQQPGLLRVIVY